MVTLTAINCPFAFCDAFFPLSSFPKSQRCVVQQRRFGPQVTLESRSLARRLRACAAAQLTIGALAQAYRPCPECAKNGVKYSRSGQTLDEIVFKKNPAGGYYGDTE